MTDEVGFKGEVDAGGLVDVGAHAGARGGEAGGSGIGDEDLLLGTSGTALPGWSVRIVDPQTGESVPNGEVGLVEIKGYVTEGYLGDPDLNQKAFTGDGYFRTGDLAKFDHLEMIKTRGINVSPVEVECLLEQIDGVLQAHVVGIDDPEHGEAIVAFIEADPGKVPPDHVKHWVAEHAASFKTPAHVLYRSNAEFPRVASGRIPRFRLREEALRELRAAGASPGELGS